MTNDYKLFLGRWARRLSWSETAQVFRTSWDTVYRAVSYMVEYGLKHRSLEGITQLGIDEIAVFKGHKYLTMVYQLNAGVRRLLWCGSDRKTDTLLTFFKEFGQERCDRIEYLCTDMWAPFLDAIRQCAPKALNILDRFHIMKKFGEAIDQIRREEHKAFKAEGESVLEKARWALLKRPENLTENQTARLADLLKLNIQSVKAYLLREDFQRFWEFKNASVAGRFLDSWCKRTMRTKLEPMKKVAKMLQNHKPLIMNWFAAKGTLSSGAVEGLNLKAKLTMRKAFGFRSTGSLKIALYHTLGKLPDPPGTHGFS
ncbi:transposase IS204/IS1001/IS1096/IS1165 family protein [mine drainage metagenome]|uniref:Transposase IS204/IS1001/IS1096/IS1165 family protein n=1 Tax=mine drainage metagenome TaxID=410659 RepID=T1AZT8_9ZZZZ